MQNKHFPFWLLTSTIFCALILPVLLKDGMFMDGLLYASISKNLSEGIGSFWLPHFSKTLYPFFEQQPPLGFGIQSVFFTLLGQTIFVERFYSFLTALITAYLIILLWRQTFNNNEKNSSWLPVLIWITIPVCFWAYSNNVLENTMGVFDLVAIIFSCKFIQRKNILHLLLSGIFIFLASLTKGLQGMFPLIVLFFGWFIYRKLSISKMIFYSLILICIPVFIYLLLFQDDTIHKSLSVYLNNRVVHSIQTQTTVDSRLYLLNRLFMELLPAICFSAIVLFFSSNKFSKNIFQTQEHKKHFFFFLLIGISASFPLMITLEQRGFYLVPSLPYYSLAFASVLAPLIPRLLNQINILQFRIFKTVAFILLPCVIIFSAFQIGKTGRDNDTIHDIHLIGKNIPKGTTLGSTRKLWEEWPLQEYLVRHYYICQDDKILPENDYLLLESEKEIPSNIKAEKVNRPTIKYHLYKVIK